MPFVLLMLAGAAGFAQDIAQRSALPATPRITAVMNESKLVTLAGNKHPLALPQYDTGAVAESYYMEHMSLQLKRSPERGQAIESEIERLQNPDSANYHKWLTAAQLRNEFGPAQADIDTITDWLSSHGFTVGGIHVGGTAIDFSGTAGQVRSAFHTEIHSYDIKGKQHIANASDPQIPAALAPVVVGVTALHDFKPKPLMKRRNPAFTFPTANYGTQFDVSPQDFNTIYNVTPLYQGAKPITGKGQTVVVLERSDINPKDVVTFRSAFGLASYSGVFSQIHPGCNAPGTGSDEGEAAIDAEWAGAVAPDANVELASCPDTDVAFGPFLAAQNLLDGANVPAIMSLSYDGCEADQGPAYNTYIAGLWQQAAAEGVSVFVASGDNGSASCDNPNTELNAIYGLAVNGLASTPYNVATGGTDFVDTFDGTNDTYWNATNGAKGRSAKSYVPEMTWNDSCASNILAEAYGYNSLVAFCNSTTGANFLDVVGGSGGASFVYQKPSWQQNLLGNPRDGKRDLPDVSLFASNGFWSHAILFCMSDASHGGAPCDYSNPKNAFSNSAGGTSFTAPQFASIQALINQKAGGPQGNPNPTYYKLAMSEYNSHKDPNSGNVDECDATKGNQIAVTCVFRDVTQGNNSVPCYGSKDCSGDSASQYGILVKSSDPEVVGYVAHKGWDFATGLGSVNVNRLVNNWK